MNDFRASLLRKVTRIYDNVAMLVPPALVDSLKTDTLEGNHLPECVDIFDRNYTIDCSVEEMLEKCAILTHILSRDFQLALQYNN